MKELGINAASHGNQSARIAPVPDYVDARVLGVATNEDHTVPSGVRWVIFSANGDFYAKAGGTAAVPAADVTDGSGSQLNPSAWELPRDGSVATIGLIAPAATVVTMAFYK